MRTFSCLLVLVACGSNGGAQDGGDDTGASSDAPSSDAPSSMNDATVDSGAMMDATVDQSADAPSDVLVLPDALLGDGGNCTSNVQCKAQQFCEKGTNSCNGGGACTLKPQVCPKIFNPVCGCDKKTYGNACEAHLAGVSVWYAGACE